MHGSEPAAIIISEEDLAPMRPRYRPASPWPARSLGAVVTVVVHMLLSAPLVLGDDAHKRRDRTNEGAGSVAWASQGEQAESMLLLDLSALTQMSKADTPDGSGYVPVFGHDRIHSSSTSPTAIGTVTSTGCTSCAPSL
jgi:hypothetical protein